jgi:hypothetical protein
MPDTPNATSADAELILRLYDLRRETQMRKARTWFAKDFWPEAFEEIQRIAYDPDLPENHYFRQVCGYWDMACSLVLRGALHPGLFYDTGGEAWFIFAKVKPFLQDMRANFNSPEFLIHMERVLESTQEGRERLARIEQNIARWAEMREATTRRSA